MVSGDPGSESPQEITEVEFVLAAISSQRDFLYNPDP
jgi:hypothetical protein